jgi:bifunctional ADP-heptose synthase (sugar kinase/adenylyltransferase)
VRTAASKLVAAEAHAAMAEAHAAGKRVALASGEFALLHQATVEHLAAARREADLLVVVVHDDGPPLVPANDRAIVVAAMRDVDQVLVSPRHTLPELLRRLRPDVYAPGSVPEETEVEAVRSYGGRILHTGDPDDETRRLMERLRQ